MKVLMLCTKFSLDESDPWLTNELADALRVLGHEVDVVAIDWSAEGRVKIHAQRMSGGVSAVVVSPVTVGSRASTVSRLIKWALSSVRAWRISRRLLARSSHDLVICYSPAVTMALPILGATRRRGRRSVLVLWDFFPYHHRQIGVLGSRVLFSLAKAAETFLLRRFDTIGCMSPRNMEYLREHYRLRPSQRVEHIPIWGKGLSVPSVDCRTTREAYGLPESRPIAVFGGQLVAGRGIEDILRAASIAATRGLPVMFLVIGDGPLREAVEAAQFANASNVRWLQRVPRNEYLKVLAACDIALVCTVRNVDIPSFPSKTIDYLRVGLPIVAAVEATTDYGDYLTSRGVGVAVDAGDAEGLLERIGMLLADVALRSRMKAQGPLSFEEDFEVGRVADRLVNAVCA